MTEPLVRGMLGAPVAPVEDIVTATPAALAELARLRARHGPLMLVQPDAGAPLCLLRDDLFVGPGDLLLGAVGGTPFYVEEEPYRRLRRPAFVLDLADGAGDALSLEAADGLHFISRAAPCEPRSVRAPMRPAPGRRTMAATQAKEADVSDPARRIREATALLGAGDEAGALQALHAALESAGDDPVVGHEIHELAVLAHDTSHGFHKIEWQRLMFDTEPHSTAV